MRDVIQVLTRGMRYSGWKQVSFRRSMTALCGSFSLTITDGLSGKAWPLPPQSDCIIAMGDAESPKPEILLTGRIDAVAADISSTEHNVTVEGRDLTADLIDCSCNLAPGEWRGLTLKALAERVAKPFGIAVVSVLASDPKIPLITLQTGESPFEILDRYCKQRGVLAATDAKGRLVLLVAGTAKADDDLVLGKNVLRASYSSSFVNRFSSYKVQGETQSAGLFKSSLDVSGIANDAEVSRYRPMVISADSQADRAYAGKRAAWEALYRAANAQTCEVTVQGWRQSSGRLWQYNETVSVSLPAIHLEARLLITDVEYSLNEQGTLTTLTLRRPDAYAAEPKTVVKKAKGLVF